MSNNNSGRKKERRAFNKFYTGLKDNTGSILREKEDGIKKESVFEHAWTFAEQNREQEIKNIF